MGSSQGSDFHSGSMDISQHKKFYKGFISGSRWCFFLIMLIMVLLALFRTHG